MLMFLYSIRSDYRSDDDLGYALISFGGLMVLVGVIRVARRGVILLKHHLAITPLIIGLARFVTQGLVIYGHAVLIKKHRGEVGISLLL